MTVGDDVRADLGGLTAGREVASPGPRLVADPDITSGTGLMLFPRAGTLPAVWVGPLPAGGLAAADAAALLKAARPCALLPEQGAGWFGRPGLSGHRLDAGGHPAAGRDWSPAFRPTRTEHHGKRARVEAEDAAAGLRLVTEAEAVPGGAIRVRHALTNEGGQPYVVDGLEVVFPLPGHVGEVLDFTGRQTAERIPQRHQLGDGLWLREARPEVAGYLFDRITGLLSEYPIMYVKWDCNRDIIDAGSALRAGAPAAYDQALAVYALLDRLRQRHPGVEWESCAAGGGRIDLAMLERVQRVWTSDMTDALARQPIQRWTGQLVPPEYLGAHVSAPFSHQTGRYMPLQLRCATALFGHLGIEWDITQASHDELAALAAWVELYKQHRALIHSGRMLRLDTPDDTAWMHGVVAADKSAALMSYVQLDEPRNDQPAAMRVPGLDPARRYRTTDVTPGQPPPRRAGLADDQIPGAEVSGAALAEIGLAIPAQRALTALVVLVEAL